jgi:hypothetical protein
MSLVLWIGPAVIRFDIVDPAKMACLAESIKQPGTTFNIVSRFGINPGRVQFVVWPEIESFDPCQQIVATQLSPAFQVSIADATVVGVNQAEAALAATAAVKGLFHLLYDVTEWLNAKVKSEK